MLEGGYQIIDFKDIEINLYENIIFEGIFNKIKNTNKTILVSGLNIEGKRLRDCFCFVSIENKNTDDEYFKVILDEYSIYIFDNDIVNIKSYFKGTRLVTSDVGFNHNGVVNDYNKEEFIEQYKNGTIILEMVPNSDQYQTVVGLADLPDRNLLRLVLRKVTIEINDNGTYVKQNY